MSPDRVILIGFMGSGKSTVGRLLAARLGWEFLDTDELVEARTGTAVTRIFRDQGERAFREQETEALASLEGKPRLVIATGGGAPAQPRNRAFFSSPAAVFHLRVSLEAVRERTRGDAGRPLLSLSPSALLALYASRQPIYDAMGTSVETDGRTPEEVAKEIAALLEAQDSQSERADWG